MKEGLFVMRIAFPSGYHIPPHTHPKSTSVTVLHGAIKLAMGVNPQLNDARDLPSDSYVVCPSAMAHAVWTESHALIQIHGIGPWDMNYVIPADDPRLRTQ